MRIAYVTTYDARDPHAWSGLGYFIWRALAAAGVAVELVGPLDVKCPPQLVGKRAINRYVRGRQYLWERAPRAARKFAAEAERALRGRSYDVVLCPDTVPIAYLENDQPLVTWTDATFASMLGFYPRLNEHTIVPESIDEGLQLERRAIQNSRLSIYGSEWAATSAIEDFGADPDQVEVVPFGANIERDPSDSEVREAIEGRDQSKCRLLFVGSDWERKGGPVAVAVAANLHDAGRDVELTVVGCDPAIPPPHRELVNVVGFVDKLGAGAARFDSLLRESHFMILPTEAECFGLPLCEASAYGVPALTTNVGGVPTVVRDGVNGALFEPNAPAESYAALIERLLDNPAAYRALANDARREYGRRLNWPTAAERIKSLLAPLL